MVEDGGLWQKRNGKQLNFGFGIYKGVFGGIVMKMWIARDKVGVICLYKCKPVLKGDYFSEYDSEGHYCIFIDRKYFPEVTFENSPMEVELVIKK